MSADGVEREEVMLEGPQQEAVAVDEADGFSKVVKRTVVKSGGDQTEVGNLYSVYSRDVPILLCSRTTMIPILSFLVLADTYTCIFIEFVIW